MSYNEEEEFNFDDYTCPEPACSVTNKKPYSNKQVMRTKNKNNKALKSENRDYISFIRGPIPDQSITESSKLGGCCAAVMIFIWKHQGYNPDQKTFEVNISTLAKLMAKSRRTVSSAIKKLKDAGLIKVEEVDGSKSKYTIMIWDEWLKTTDVQNAMNISMIKQDKPGILNEAVTDDDDELLKIVPKTVVQEEVSRSPDMSAKDLNLEEFAGLRELAPEETPECMTREADSKI